MTCTDDKVSFGANNNSLPNDKISALQLDHGEINWMIWSLYITCRRSLHTIHHDTQIFRVINFNLSPLSMNFCKSNYY